MPQRLKPSSGARTVNSRPYSYFSKIQEGRGLSNCLAKLGKAPLNAYKYIRPFTNNLKSQTISYINCQSGLSELRRGRVLGSHNPCPWSAHHGMSCILIVCQQFRKCIILSTHKYRIFSRIILEPCYTFINRKFLVSIYEFLQM